MVVCSPISLLWLVQRSPVLVSSWYNLHCALVSPYTVCRQAAIRLGFILGGMRLTLAQNSFASMGLRMV